MTDLTLKDYINTHSNIPLQHIVERYNVPLKTVLSHFSGCQFVSAKNFDLIWQDVRSWGEIMFLLHLPDIIVEIESELPAGEYGHGYFNLSHQQGFSGHLKVENCQDIAFIERKFSTMDSAAIIFLNQEGYSMFEIFVGYQKDGEDLVIRQEQLLKFRQLANQLN